jgi:thiol-disulfide isomerase/thioredoxin
MKRLVIIAIVFFISAASYAQSIKRITINELEEYIHTCNHPLVVNFWATSCGPCVREISYFQNIINKYKDAGIELLLISLDIPKFYPQIISLFAKEKNISASIFWLDEKNTNYFCPKIDKRWRGEIPSTLMVNNKSKMYTFFDRQLTDQQFEIEIKKLIKK